jgi:ribosomal protein S18 acetylase RimI-like enzyme
LGQEEVYAYLRDLVKRLSTASVFPTVWCPITESGESLLHALVDVVKSAFPEWLKRIQILGIEVDGDERESRIKFLDDPQKSIEGNSLLLLDGAVHSGRMMRDCVDEVLKHKPSAVSSYTLVIKKCSLFIPTMWGLMMDEQDRAYFLLSEIPNQRLNVGKKSQLPLHIRLLEESHTARPPVVSGVASMDRMTWWDRLYQMNASDGDICTYVLECSDAVAGYLTVRYFDPAGLAIDEIAVDISARRAGYGGILIRFADTLARHSNARIVRLNAIENRIDWYEGHHYFKSPGKAVLSLDKERYQPMDRKVLYHKNPYI